MPKTTETKPQQPTATAKTKAENICPICSKGIMKPESGCMYCSNCAWSPCAG